MALILDRTTPLDEILACAKEVYGLQDQTQQHQVQADVMAQTQTVADRLEERLSAYIASMTALFVEATGLEPIIAQADIHLTDANEPDGWELLPELTLRIRTMNSFKGARGPSEKVTQLITYDPDARTDFVITTLGDLGRVVARHTARQQREDQMEAKKAALEALDEVMPSPPPSTTIISQGLHGGLRLIPDRHGLTIYPYYTPVFDNGDATGAALGFRFPPDAVLKFAQALDAQEGTVVINNSELDLVIVGEDQLEWVLLPRGFSEAIEEWQGVTMRQVYSVFALAELRAALAAYLAYQVDLEAHDKLVEAARHALRQVTKAAWEVVG